MQTSVETLSSIKKKINFEIPADRVAKEIDKAYGKIRKSASIPGFRKGKVPQSYLEKYFSGAMADDVLKSIVNDTYFAALIAEKIMPVSMPTIESDEVVKGEPLKYSATFEVMPEIEVKDYMGLQVKKEIYSANDEVIANRLKEMQENMAQLKPIEEDRPAAMGDFVVFDFNGSIDGVAIDGGSAEDYELELGSNRFIPGFEEQLVGFSKGDERDVAVTFPAEYGNKELAGKEAVFAIKMKGLKVKELPALDDDFAAQFGAYETFAEMRAALEESYAKQEKERIEGDLKDRIVHALIEKNEIEVPETMVERQLQGMLENMKRRLASRKLTLDIMGMDDDKFKEQYRSVAETQVKGSLLLAAVAKKEGVTADEADFEARLVEMAGGVEQTLESMKNFYANNDEAKGSMLAQIREDKAMDLLLAKGEIQEVAADQL